MVVLDRTPDRFTPEELKGRSGAPVYLIQPADMLAKATFRRALASMGANYPSTAVLLEALREGVRTGLAEDQRAGFLALLDRGEDVQSAKVDALRAAIEAAGEEAESALPELPELVHADRVDLDALQRDMRLNYRPYAELLADRQYYLDVAPVLAAQHFLVGWENVDLEFERTRGIVDIALLQAAVPEAHIASIGNRAMALMQPTRDEEKNSGSRPGSPAGRGTSTADSGRSTARPGKSRAKSTKRTRAS